jgi:hypothetical protein
MTTHFPGLTKSVVLTHKYMTTHFPGLTKSVVVTHKYMTTHFHGLCKSVALTHLCVRATDFASTLLMFDFGIVSTVCYFVFHFTILLAHLTRRSRYYPKPAILPYSLCSIFSNSGHVGWCTASPDTILKLDTLVMIQTKFGFHWSSTFRGEDF